MPKTSDTIIGEQQSDVFKNRILLHTISIICDITDVSHKLNNNLFVISLEVDFIFSALHQFGYGDKFIHMIKIDSYDKSILNIKLKLTASYLAVKPLCEFARSVYSPCCYTLHAVILSMLLYIIATEVLD